MFLSCSWDYVLITVENLLLCLSVLVQTNRELISNPARIRQDLPMSIRLLFP